MSTVTDVLVGFSGRWPRVYHQVREEPPGAREYSACGNFIKLDFFYHESEMPALNESMATNLTRCRSCPF